MCWDGHSGMLPSDEIKSSISLIKSSMCHLGSGQGTTCIRRVRTRNTILESLPVHSGPVRGIRWYNLDIDYREKSL